MAKNPMQLPEQIHYELPEKGIPQYSQREYEALRYMIPPPPRHLLDVIQRRMEKNAHCSKNKQKSSA